MFRVVAMAATLGMGCVTAGLRGRAVAGSELPLLLDLGALTDAVAEVVELGPTDVATGPDLDAVDDR